MSSTDCQNRGLHSMGDHYDYNSLDGADLDENDNAEAMKKASLSLQPMVLSQLVSKVY